MLLSTFFSVASLTRVKRHVLKRCGPFLVRPIAATVQYKHFVVCSNSNKSITYSVILSLRNIPSMQRNVLLTAFAPCAKTWDVLFKIRRIGFRRIGKTPVLDSWHSQTRHTHTPSRTIITKNERRLAILQIFAIGLILARYGRQKPMSFLVHQQSSSSSSSRFNTKVWCNGKRPHKTTYNRYLWNFRILFLLTLFTNKKSRGTLCTKISK